MRNAHPQAIRWGIWGTGTIAGTVASDFQLIRGEARLDTVASRSLDRARQFAARYRIPHSCAGLDALLGNAEIDAVYIASPNHRHLQDSLAVLEAGKAVLCEKPFALNSAQARQIETTARTRNVFCMEAMWTRFLPAIQGLKRMIDAGAIGRVRLIQGNFAYPDSPNPLHRLYDLAAGGGVLLDRGVYLVSLAQHLLGKPESVHASATLSETGVDEQSAYQLRFGDGALADFAASFKTRGNNEFNIFGEEGTIQVCDPFFATHRLLVEHRARQPGPSRSDASAQPDAPSQRLATRLRHAPTAKLILRKLGPIPPLLRRRFHAQNFPFPGNGYQFELLEVGRCLREHLVESPTMPLDQTLEVMNTMDALRAQFGVVYPQEQSGGHDEF